MEITNEIDASNFQSELNIFAIWKFRLENNDIGNDNDDINLHPGPFNNPQMFKRVTSFQQQETTSYSLKH